MTASSWLAALAALSLASGCTPVCDKDGLQRAAEAFAADGTESRQAGLTALQAACPTLPPALAPSLADPQSPDEAGHLRRSRAEDPAWRELLAHTCQPMTPPTQPIVLEQLDSDVRRFCDLGRYDLLVPEATFARQDVVVFMLHEWLLAGRIGRARAAEVTSPLLTASVLAKRDLAPPLGSIDLPPHGGAELRISPTTLSLADTPVLPLVGGRAPAAFVRHVAPELRTALAEVQRRGLEHAERVGVAWDAHVAVLADRATPMGTIVDALYTATKAGLSSFELIVHDGDELRSQPIGVAYQWFPPTDEIREERPLKLWFVMRGDSVVASTAQDRERGRAFTFTRSACPPQSAVCRDIADLVQYTQNMKNLYPREVVAAFHVDPDVTLQALVSLIDLVRGEGCALIGPFLKGEKIPDECLFWQPLVDLDPPLDHLSDQAAD